MLYTSIPDCGNRTPLVRPASTEEIVILSSKKSSTETLARIAKHLGMNVRDLAGNEMTQIGYAKNYSAGRRGIELLGYTGTMAEICTGYTIVFSDENNRVTDTCYVTGFWQEDVFALTFASNN